MTTVISISNNAINTLILAKLGMCDRTKRRRIQRENEDNNFLKGEFLIIIIHDVK